MLAANPTYLFNLKLPGTGFGPTNKLAIQFFITRGGEPIYDIPISPSDTATTV
jgi:hypothetical protein